MVLQNQNVALPFPWLLWLGLPPVRYATFDYFPLLPWFGLILLGIWLGGLGSTPAAGGPSRCPTWAARRPSACWTSWAAIPC